VKGPWDTALVSDGRRPSKLAKKGYIPRSHNSNDAAPEAKSMGSGGVPPEEVTGADETVRPVGVTIHSFKATQPTLKWLDPSYAARGLVAGDVVRKGWPEDQVAPAGRYVKFLGIEPKPGTTKGRTL